MTRTRWGRTVWWLAAVRPSDGRLHWWWDRTEPAHLARLADMGEGWVVVGRVVPIDNLYLVEYSYFKQESGTGESQKEIHMSDSKWGAQKQRVKREQAEVFMSERELAIRARLDELNAGGRTPEQMSGEYVPARPDWTPDELAERTALFDELHAIQNA